MVLIYVYGCAICGINARYVRAVTRWCKKNEVNLEIRNSKYDSSFLSQHVGYLGLLQLSSDSYDPIVVNNGKASRLREWNL